MADQSRFRRWRYCLISLSQFSHRSSVALKSIFLMPDFFHTCATFTISELPSKYHCCMRVFYRIKAKLKKERKKPMYASDEQWLQGILPWGSAVRFDCWLVIIVVLKYQPLILVDDICVAFLQELPYELISLTYKGKLSIGGKNKETDIQTIIIKWCFGQIQIRILKMFGSRYYHTIYS